MEDNLYKVEKIRRKKFDENRQEWLYLVKWQGYDTDESTWEPEENLCYIPSLVEKFNKKWEQKQSLMKEKKKITLEKLVNQKKLRLSKMNVDFETSEIVRKADERLLMIDEEEERSEKKISQFFKEIRCEKADVYSDIICKIIGLRDVKGKIFVAVMFRVNKEKVFRVEVVDFETVRNAFPKLLREYLKRNILSR